MSLTNANERFLSSSDTTISVSTEPAPPLLRPSSPQQLSKLPFRVRFDPLVNRSSWQQTTLVVMAEVMGAGVLGLPRAFAQLGWVFGVFSVVLFAATAAYAGCLLARVRNCIYPHASSYADLALETVGPRFSALTKLCMHVTWGLLLPFYLITANKALQGAAHSLHWCEYVRSLIVVAVLVLPLQIRNLHLISYFATLSTGATFVAVGTACVVLIGAPEQVAGAGAGAGAGAVTPTPLLPRAGTDFLQMYGSFAALIFAYQGQSMFCEIMREMKDSRQFPRAVGVGNGCMMAVYLFVVVVANAVKGEDVADFLPDAMPGGVPKIVINLLIVYITCVGFVITGQPLHRAMHGALSPSTLDSGGLAGALPWAVITIASLALSYVIANAVPFFSDVQGLLGALTGAPIVFGWPALFFLTACHKNNVAVPRVDRLCCCVSLFLFFPLFTVLGVVNALKDIDLDWTHNGGPFSC